MPLVELKCVATFQLDFLPFRLTHYSVQTSLEEGDVNTVFLVSGSDDLIHAFAPSPLSTAFEELQDEEITNLFPEFSQHTPSPATDISFAHRVVNNDGLHRWSVIACQEGQVQVFKVDVFKRELLMSFEDLDFAGAGGIYHAKFFDLPFDLSQQNSGSLNLLLVPALERTAMFFDIANQQNGFQFNTGTERLEYSSDFDSVNACAIIDLDGDGYPEIVIGTYGQELLVYKMYPRNEENESNILSRDTFANLAWKLWARQAFPDPILAIQSWVNSNEDDNKNKGVHNEYSRISTLVVTTNKAIHILQYDQYLNQTTTEE